MIIEAPFPMTALKLQQHYEYFRSEKCESFWVKEESLQFAVLIYLNNIYATYSSYIKALKMLPTIITIQSVENKAPFGLFILGYLYLFIINRYGFVCFF